MAKKTGPTQNTTVRTALEECAKPVDLLYGHPSEGGWIRDEAVEAAQKTAETISVKLRELAMNQVLAAGGTLSSNETEFSVCR